jgi:hypothetical protein
VSERLQLLKERKFFTSGTAVAGSMIERWR